MNLLLFKRDLRLEDHAPLEAAIKEGKSLLMLFVYEPSLMHQPQYSERHWRFVHQSVQDLNEQLKPYRAKVWECISEIIPLVSELEEQHGLEAIFSHEETGIATTYERDKALAEYCQIHRIRWREFPSNGVRRGLRNRKTWKQDWYDTMQRPQAVADLAQLKSYPLPEGSRWSAPLPNAWQIPDPHFQYGGEQTAHKVMQTFFTDRCGQYVASVSKPQASQWGCSRLSPYLAWGNLSVRQVYQAYREARTDSLFKRPLSAFADRLRWHCHFIQKFEMEDRIEFENLNRGYDLLPRRYQHYLVKAWKEGRTGFPLVDASMRCVRQTGYLNFRMRAMLVSFLTHHLWQPWQAGADHLAAQFLDFEPGIHYPQFQMQSCASGVNMIRIYNPAKQSRDHDPEGIFIRAWLPELRHLPTVYLHEPYRMTPLEQGMYHFKLGKDYPKPIVDLEAAARHARDALFAHHEHPVVMRENARILRRHTLPDRNAS